MLEIVFLEPNKTILKSIIQALSIAFEIFIIIVVGIFIGMKLDQYLNTAPLFLIIGCIFSIVTCFKKIIVIGGK